MTDNRTTELLPCPFCGGGDIHVGWTDFDSGVIYVECNTCGMYCEPKDCYANESKAIAAWNTRADLGSEPSSLKELIAEAVSCCVSATGNNGWYETEFDETEFDHWYSEHKHLIRKVVSADD